ncbi:MAG: HlyC/CorC family transporter [Zetaproteobacteria bacterium]|nr:MAG: HlyC/CorC family transporter [Zetaproteobacteria bacterium]
MNVLQRVLRAGRHRLLTWLRPGQSVDELLEIIRRAEAIRSDEQRTMLEGMIEFHETRVREIMVPRSDIHAVAADAGFSEVERTMVQFRVNRLPVMDGDIDHILGAIHASDLVAWHAQGGKGSLRQHIRRCLRVSELEKVAGLLTEMKRESVHMAIVHDEYGGTAGLVTLADVLTEIVGAMAETRELADGGCTPQQDGSYIVAGRMLVEELAEALNLALPQGDFDTIAGLITSELGRIPRRGEELTMHGLRIRVMESDARRIVKLRISRINDPQ